MKTVFLLCLLLAGGVLAPQMQAQSQASEQPSTTEREAAPLPMTVLEDLEAVKPIKPTVVAYREGKSIETKDREALENKLAQQYGFGRRNSIEPGAISASHDPAANDKTPFPSLDSEGIDTHPDPFMGGPTNIESVRAQKPGRYHYDKAPDAVQWRWKVPTALQKNYFFLSQNINNDRYAALCLIPADAAKMPPMLYSFDSLTGLRWQTPIPVHEAQRQYAQKIGVTIPKAYLSNRLIGGRIGVIAAYDGSRTLVAITPNKPDATFLFIYDSEGTLLRTLVFPCCVIGSQLIDSTFTHGLGRAPKINCFAITFYWTPPRELQDKYHSNGALCESLMIDGEGDVQGRFVDEGGLPLDINRLSDTHALASVFSKEDKTNHRLLYELPK